MDQKLNGAKRRIDPVTAAIDEVRADLAARRAAGEIPELPPGELERQFSAVVEAADGLFVDEPPLDASGLAPVADDGDVGAAADRAPRADRRSIAMAVVPGRRHHRAAPGRAVGPPHHRRRRAGRRPAEPTRSASSGACTSIASGASSTGWPSSSARSSACAPRRRAGPRGRFRGDLMLDQLVVGAAPGDAITRSALLLRDELAKLGPANVYAQFREPGVLDRGRAVGAPRRSPERRPTTHLPRQHGFVARSTRR